MSTLSNVTVYRFSKGTSYYLTKRLANGDMRYDSTQRTLSFGTEGEVQILAVQADGDELSELQPHGDQSDQIHPPVQHRNPLYAVGVYPQRPVRHRLGGKRRQWQLTVTFCIMTQNDNLTLSKKNEPQNFSAHNHRKKSTRLFLLGGLSCFFPKSFIFCPSPRHTNSKRENCSTGRRRML